jgi:hypothetical protein
MDLPLHSGIAENKKDLRFSGLVVAKSENPAIVKIGKAWFIFTQEGRRGNPFPGNAASG